MKGPSVADGEIELKRKTSREGFRKHIGHVAEILHGARSSVREVI